MIACAGLPKPSYTIPVWPDPPVGYTWRYTHTARPTVPPFAVCADTAAWVGDWCVFYSSPDSRMFSHTCRYTFLVAVPIPGFVDLRPGPRSPSP